jgi:hypothetical protein
VREGARKPADLLAILQAFPNLGKPADLNDNGSSHRRGSSYKGKIKVRLQPFHAFPVPRLNAVLTRCFYTDGL